MMTETQKTNADAQHSLWRGCLIAVLVSILLMFCVVAAGYVYLKTMLLGNGRTYTKQMYSSYLQEYEKLHGEFPTCQPLEGFAWLSIPEAVCRDKYLPELAEKAALGFSYEEFLDYRDDVVRVAIRRQTTEDEGFCLVYFHGLSDKQIQEIDLAMRNGRFRGSDSLESLLVKAGGEIRVIHRGDWLSGSPSDQINFIETFSRGHLLPATR